MGNTNPLWAILFSVIIILINFIPSFIAFSRKHPRRMPILIFNIMFGWTGIGWILLLVWAFNPPPQDDLWVDTKPYKHT
jgi:CHASE2 domain-containing sensor protein